MTLVVFVDQDCRARLPAIFDAVTLVFPFIVFSTIEFVSCGLLTQAGGRATIRPIQSSLKSSTQFFGLPRAITQEK